MASSHHVPMRPKRGKATGGPQQSNNMLRLEDRTAPPIQCSDKQHQTQDGRRIGLPPVEYISAREWPAATTCQCAQTEGRHRVDLSNKTACRGWRIEKHLPSSVQMNNTKHKTADESDSCRLSTYVSETQHARKNSTCTSQKKEHYAPGAHVQEQPVF